MNAAATKTPIRNGLRDIPMHEFWKDPLIVVDTLNRKLAGLPIDQKKLPSFAQDVRLALELLRAVEQKRYGRISFLAVLDILRAVDYLLVFQDRTQDGRDDGYEDDAEVFRHACDKHRLELQEFEKRLSVQA